MNKTNKTKSIKISKFPIGNEPHNLYIHIIYNDSDDVKMLLVNIGKGSTMDIADYESIIRLTNRLIKINHIEDVIKELSGIDAGIRYRYKDKVVLSFSDLIAKVIYNEINLKKGGNND